MEKTLTIDGKKVPFKCTGGFLIRYKELTGSDPIKDIYDIGIAMNGAVDSGKVDLDKFNVNVMYNLVWVLAKTADASVPDLLTWLDSFEDFPIFTVFKDLQQMIVNAFATTKTIEASKKKIPSIKK